MLTPVRCDACARSFVMDVEAAVQPACPECGDLLAPPAHADVFVSYARADEAHAQQVAERLGAAGISCWVDRDRIRPGEDFTDSISTALSSVRVVVLILSTRAVESTWVKDEIALAKTLGRRIVPLRIEAFDLPASWRFMLAHHQWKDAADGSSLDGFVADVQSLLLREAAHETARPIAGRPIAAHAPEGVDPAVSPFVGPQPFPRYMADRFFGRQHEADSLLHRIATERLILVYAPSGAGKSSLLNTLIAGHLDEAGHEVLLDARVGGALPSNIRSADIRNIYTFALVCGLERTTPPPTAVRLADYLRARGRKPGTHSRTLILDQFEELFTHHPERFEHRRDFLLELVASLDADPALRIVLAIRQEYLADVEALAAALPAHIPLKRFPLRRMTPEAAMDAIVQPAARYAVVAPEVADAIVDQLSTIRVVGFDGVPVVTQGEFVEMVHLQIVCQRLWKTLPRGITRVELTHLEGSAGEGRSSDDFVSHALKDFYEQTIDEVVNSPITKAHGAYSKDLIRLGCMKFITSASTRTMVPRANGRTGRLPDWIVEQLENHHLLREEERGGERWYELSHDNLVQMVAGSMDRNFAALLFAADLLAKVLENALRENGGTLAGYFDEHAEVLSECKPFQAQPGLFEDEAEFVFRASLRLGRDMVEWSRRIKTDFPATRARVMEEALASPQPLVRQHAAELFGDDPLDGLGPVVCALALDDVDPKVRRAAVMSITRLDREDLYDELVRAHGQPARARSAFDALSHIRAAVDSLVDAPRFERTFTLLPWRLKRRIRMRSWELRFLDGLPTFGFVLIPASLLAAVGAASYKWLPGMFNWAVCQATASAAVGVFHGVVAGVVWAGTITLAITLYHVIFGKRGTPSSTWRPAGAVVAGLIGGIVSSATVVFLVSSIYDTSALMKMGWVAGPDGESALAQWRDLFITYRFGWVYMIAGTGLGIGMALASNAVRASEDWRVFMAAQHGGLSGLRDTMRVLRQIMRIVVRHAWLIAAAVTLAASLAFFAPDTRTPASADSVKSDPWSLAEGLFADCSTQIIGAYFGLCGMALGLVLMRRGFTLEARGDSR